MTHVTCRLTAKNRDQLRNPTLANRVWATFPFFKTVSATGDAGDTSPTIFGQPGDDIVCQVFSCRVLNS